MEGIGIGSIICWRHWFPLYLIVLSLGSTHAQQSQVGTRIHVLVLYENSGHHLEYTNAAVPWLKQLAADSSFVVDFITDTKTINEALLSNYQLFIQLDYPPYGWTEEAVIAFEKFIEEGKGGWIGFHHATLLGEFDGYPMWDWFSGFMGGIRYKNYIATFAEADVRVEAMEHPVMKGLPGRVRIKKEEWYTYNQSPRANVQVLASVDEATYQPDSEIKMGDHPVVWTNPLLAARNVYIFMGHSPLLFDNEAYTTLVRNAIFWTAGE
ncbi:MAG: ThuA domain-containing protein [Imperialibacter sp.]|uniref:ThuA domain-containing protein n=1 Tax=Imperialibacter sp. TaxID=2038411 RepID=UPI0032EB0AC4